MRSFLLSSLILCSFSISVYAQDFKGCDTEKGHCEFLIHLPAPTQTGSLASGTQLGGGWIVFSPAHKKVNLAGGDYNHGNLQTMSNGVHIEFSYFTHKDRSGDRLIWEYIDEGDEMDESLIKSILPVQALEFIQNNNGLYTCQSNMENGRAVSAYCTNNLTP